MTVSYKILVVEDDPWFAEQQLRTLGQAGFETAHARDGISAMDMLDKDAPDVIVLDIFLPGPNALVLLHEMQSHSDLAKIPVVVCTGSAADIPLDKFASYGVVEVLDKSTMLPEDLVRAIRRALL